MRSPICVTCAHLKRFELGRHGSPNARRYFCEITGQQLRTNAKSRSDLLLECENYDEATVCNAN